MSKEKWWNKKIRIEKRFIGKFEIPIIANEPKTQKEIKSFGSSNIPNKVVEFSHSCQYGFYILIDLIDWTFDQSVLRKVIWIIICQRFTKIADKVQKKAGHWS